HLVRIAQNQRLSNLELIFAGKNGEKIPMSLSASPLHDSSGQVIGCVSIGIDLSEKKKLEQQMAQSQKLVNLSVMQLRELEDMRQNFLSQITHEFRSPLSAAQAIVGMIAKGDYGNVPQNLIDPLMIVQNNNERLTRLIDELLAAFKLDA